ncbi:hypothetical protein F2Q69_00013413 [Brassica cretica]|uniref:Uncharacterized protein n=1 Tax=Brassica cretica TaxID=69181 RepID=A0A8S9R1D0_BRACR|nr:hypothetical protein F2Q69_00013413 [Brassica cretica]
MSRSLRCDRPSLSVDHYVATDPQRVRLYVATDPASLLVAIDLQRVIRYIATDPASWSVATKDRRKSRFNQISWKGKKIWNIKSCTNPNPVAFDFTFPKSCLACKDSAPEHKMHPMFAEVRDHPFRRSKPPASGPRIQSSKYKTCKEVHARGSSITSRRAINDLIPTSLIIKKYPRFRVMNHVNETSCPKKCKIKVQNLAKSSSSTSSTFYKPWPTRSKPILFKVPKFSVRQTEPGEKNYWRNVLPKGSLLR